jgi:nucleotide sugar dehydrogenase
MKPKIGFIGQGWIGKNYADNFEAREYEVIRYGLEEPYNSNKEKIKDCDIVFIAVPTPTTTQGFNDKILREVIKLVGLGKIAVIKSTIIPGTAESIQEENPDVFVLHSPEFLTTHTAAHDAAHPDRNIIGIPKETDEYYKRASEVMSVLPEATFQTICWSRDAEMIKYGGNCFFYFKNIFFNLFYDVVIKNGCDWQKVREAVIADPRIGEVHTEPIHKGGRGAGGECLIKDFQAFLEMYKEKIGDKKGIEILESIRDKNLELLIGSGKNLDLLKGVYGEEVVNK